MTAITKALLICYSHIDSAINTIDNHIEDLIRACYYAHGINDEIRIYVKIIGLNSHKQRLKNLKYVINHVLNECDYTTRTILVNKYINNKSIEWIAKRYKQCVRTVYRYLDKCYNKFSIVLQNLNFTEQMLLDYFQDESLFNNALKEVNKNDRTRKARKGY